MEITRNLSSTIFQSLQHFPVVGILGPRQVGKTTLAKYIAREYPKKVLYLDIELPSDLNKLQDPELYLSQQKDALVIIDEIQRFPNLFPILRAVIDQQRSNGKFLILGSASPSLLKQSSESLAGRIIYHELSPLSFVEAESAGVTTKQLWQRGGFPESILASSDAVSQQWRAAFVQTYLERDIPLLGKRIPAIRLHRFLTMVGHCHGQLWNASPIAKSLDMKGATVRTYLDLLTDTFLVRQLQPYHHNMKKRMVKSPKVYIRDSGLLHTLLDIPTHEQLQGRPVIGNSWEGFVIEQVLEIIPSQWRAYFFRTLAGAEIDLVLFDDVQKPIAIEIKYSLSPKLEKGFWHAYADLQCEKGFVVYPGKEVYSLRGNITVTPLEHLASLVA